MKFTPLAILALFAAPAAAQGGASPDQRFDAMDADKNGQISRAEFDQFTQARHARQSQDMDKAFTLFDKDKDGKLTQAEANAHPVIGSIFTALDADKNGTLSKAEMQSALKQSQTTETGTM